VTTIDNVRAGTGAHASLKYALLRFWNIHGARIKFLVGFIVSIGFCLYVLNQPNVSDVNLVYVHF